MTTGTSSGLYLMGSPASVVEWFRGLEGFRVPRRSGFNQPEDSLVGSFWVAYSNPY